MGELSIRELTKIMREAYSIDEIDKYQDEIVNLIPSTKTMIGFDQKNSAHQYDLWYHSLHTVLNLPFILDDDMIYLAALLHDIGKPNSIVIKDGDPDYHYYGHPEESYRIILHEHDLLARLMYIENYSKRDVGKLLYYIRYHDYRMSNKRKHLRNHLCYLTIEEFKHLMQLEVADAKAHVIKPIIQERIYMCDLWCMHYFLDKQYKAILDEIDSVKSLRNLFINRMITSDDILKGKLG